MPERAPCPAAGPQPSGGSGGGRPVPLGPAVGGLVVRLKYSSVYELAQVHHVAEFGGKPLLAVQARYAGCFVLCPCW